MKMKFFICTSLLIICIMFFYSNLNAATFIVNTTDDTVDVNPGDGIATDVNGNCSLRAAIMEANALYGPDIINIPEGIYILYIKGEKENKCEKGDIDIRSKLEIHGAGQNATIIDGNHIDRVFQIIGTCEVSISNLTIKNGKAPPGKIGGGGEDGEDGGGIHNKNSTVTLSHCNITDNSAGKGGASWNGFGDKGGNGGGIWNSGILTFNQCIISNNKAGDGGWAEWDGGNGGNGGGIYNTGTLTLTECAIIKNSSGFGGGWAKTIGGNGGNGGGICNHDGKMILNSCEIYKNITGSGGDAYYLYGYPGNGGGIYNSTLINNSILRNCTVSKNEVGSYIYDIYPGEGGGIYNNGIISLFNNTIYNNIVHKPNFSGYAGNGGGIYNCKLSTVNIKNTIIAANRVGRLNNGPDCYGSFVSQNHNLIEKTSGCNITGDIYGNIYGQDPKLGHLTNNGGPTMTHALLPSSPAIDTGGSENFESTDQRGVRRPKDGDNDGIAISDIGAFELFEPYVEITHPKKGAVLNGIQIIQVNTNCQNVDFYIGNELKYTANSSPFTYEWDTTLYNNGSHNVKVTAYDISEISCSDETTVKVQNIVINLNVSKHEERAWIIKKQYGKVSFTIENTGNLSVSKYIIYRKKEGEEYSSIKEISNAELTQGFYTYYDLFSVENITYTYQIKAFDTDRMVIGTSQEKNT